MLLLLVLSLFLLGLSIRAMRNGANFMPKECKPHKWVLRFEADSRGYLVCKECGKIPGEDR